MSTSSVYSGMSLAEFMEALLKTYVGLEAVMEQLADRDSAEREAYHTLTLGEHTGVTEIAQYGIRYRIARVSNVRYATGYTEYTFTIVNIDEFETDNATMTYRLFRKTWEEWVTLLIA